MFKIGCDPEVFLIKGKVPIPAPGVVPGTKDCPHPVKRGAVQVDGLALEFNTHPVETKKEFVRNVTSVMRSLKRMIPEGSEFFRGDSLIFPGSVVSGVSERDLEIGCDPDFDAYRAAYRERDIRKDRLMRQPDGSVHRTASGHIHIGWRSNQPIDYYHIQDCRLLVRQLDWIFADAFNDQSSLRSVTYGRKGGYRPKPYGVEYRSLGNWWIWKKSTIEAVYDRVAIAFSELEAGNFLPYYTDEHPNEFLRRRLL